MTAQLDDNQAAAEAAAAADAAAATPDASADTQGADAKPTYEELEAKAKLSDDLDREIKRLHGVLKATKERQRTGTRTDSAPDEDEPKTPARQTARRTSDLEPDDDGYVVFDGEKVTPVIARRLAAVDTLSAELEAVRTGLQARSEAEEEAREAAILSSYETATNSAAIELRKQLIPGLEGDEAKDADDMAVALLAAKYERRAKDDGFTPYDLTPEDVLKDAREVVGRVRRFREMSVKRQLDDNEAAREANKVRTGGPPAVPPGKRLRELTPRERREAADRAAQAAEAMSQG